MPIKTRAVQIWEFCAHELGDRWSTPWGSAGPVLKAGLYLRWPLPVSASAGLIAGAAATTGNMHVPGTRPKKAPATPVPRERRASAKQVRLEFWADAHSAILGYF